MSDIFLKNIERVLYVFRLNPVFLFKRIFSELKAKILPLPKPGIYKINGVSFNFDFNFSHKIKKMYFGTFQPIISEIIKKYLREGDTFIDVGANIGYFSLIGAGIVGQSGQVHSFEPVPEYFIKLDNFAKINKNYRIKTNKLALGDKKESLEIFIKGGKDIGNNTFFPELLDGREQEKVSVSVVRLDEYIKENNLNNIKLIKIDVEGFEFSVLKGLSKYFSECSVKKEYPVIVCEIVPEIYPKLGCKLKDLFDYMAQFSYYPFNVLNTEKKLNIDLIAKDRVTDIIFKNIKK